jgi:hypothetical protein
MSKELQLGLNKFINFKRLKAPQFLSGMVTWPLNGFVIMVVLVYLISQLSFWPIQYHYNCDCCSAEHQAKIFNLNCEMTVEYS